MNVLAIGQMTGKNIQPFIEAEKQAMAELRRQGLIREFLLKADRTGPILLLNDVDAAKAERHLAALPFVKEELLTFELVELITFDELDN